MWYRRVDVIQGICDTRNTDIGGTTLANRKSGIYLRRRQIEAWVTERDG
jgi:hypothetical protein